MNFDSFWFYNETVDSNNDKIKKNTDQTALELFSSLWEQNIDPEFRKYIFNIWNEWLKSLSAEIISKFYIENHENWYNIDWKSILRYVMYLLWKKTIWEILKDKIVKIWDNIYIHTWIYNFKFNNDNWKKIILKTIFQFVWENMWNNNWKMISHNFSLIAKNK